MSDNVDKMIEEGLAGMFTSPDVTFEVVTKIRAVRGDGKVIETLFGPILLYDGDSLYRAMFIMGAACEVERFKADPDQLADVAQQVANELGTDKFEWSKRKDAKQ